jgi:hypothetical protein
MLKKIALSGEKLHGPAPCRRQELASATRDKLDRLDMFCHRQLDSPHPLRREYRCEVSLQLALVNDEPPKLFPRCVTDIGPVWTRFGSPDVPESSSPDAAMTHLLLHVARHLKRYQYHDQ